MELKLVPPHDEILNQELKPFDFSNPPCNPIELYNSMGKMLFDTKALGLAANQIGLPYRFFVIRSDPIVGMFNPRIVDSSTETIELEEGCLSYPEVILKIKRPRVIKVRYAEPNGTIQTKVFQDMTARIIQHELDHLNGISFGAHVSRLQLERAIKKSGKHYVIGDLL